MKNLSSFSFNKAQDIMLCAYKHQNCWRTPSARHRWQLGCKHPKRVSPFTSVFRKCRNTFSYFPLITRIVFFPQEGSYMWGLIDQRRLGFDRPAVLHLLVILHLLITRLTLFMTNFNQIFLSLASSICSFSQTHSSPSCCAF